MPHSYNTKQEIVIFVASLLLQCHAIHCNVAVASQSYYITDHSWCWSKSRVDYRLVQRFPIGDARTPGGREKRLLRVREELTVFTVGERC